MLPLQTRLPFLPWMDPRTRRMPGILPVEGDDWLRVDEAFGPQMARREALMAADPARVHALLPEGRAAAEELYARVLARLAARPGYRIGSGSALRPDGVEVPLDPAAPLMTLGRLVQEDLCLMQASDQGHRLTGAILCFPASWTLAQKLGRPLLDIHIPVPLYTEDLARRVQRLFDAIRPEQPLWRMNWLTYDDPELHQPRREGEKRPRPRDHGYVRSERQCLLRLPQTGAVVFTIHTYVVPIERFSAEERAALLESLH